MDSTEKLVPRSSQKCVNKSNEDYRVSLHKTVYNQLLLELSQCPDGDKSNKGTQLP